MNKFKVGDRVRTTQYVEYSEHQEGDVGTVTTTEGNSGNLVRVKMDLHNTSGDTPFTPKELELVEEKPARKYKTGDRVRYVGADHWNSFKPGALGTVVRTEPESFTASVYMFIEFDGIEDHGAWSSLTEDELEAVIETKEETLEINDGDAVRLTRDNEGLEAGHEGVVLKHGSKSEGSPWRVLISYEAGHTFTSDTPAWWVDKSAVEKVEEPTLKKGDTVRLVKDYAQFSKGDIYTVETNDGTSGIAIRLVDERGYYVTWADARDLEKVKTEEVKPERPKAESVDKRDVQIGDTVVCFWDEKGVETRKKGVVASKDWEGDLLTVEGGYLNHSDDTDDAWASHIYIVERAPKPVELTGYDALDKSKVYYIPLNVAPQLPGDHKYLLKHNGTQWVYTNLSATPQDADAKGNWVSALAWEGQFTEGKGSWSKPVEYQKTWQEKVEAAGHKTTDLWVLGAMTQRFNPETGRWEFKGSGDGKWFDFNTSEAFLAKLAGENSHEYVKVAL